jgi:hypothetical protein
MEPKVDRPVARRARYLMSVDAFLLSGALFMVALGLTAFGFPEPSVWSQLASQLVLVGSVLAGAVLAWTLHGHPLRATTWLGLVAGTILGAAVAVPVFLALLQLGRLLQLPFPDQEGPWAAIALVTVVVVAYLAVAAIGAVRDLANRTGSSRIAVVRLGALVVMLATVVITLLIGGETAEAGLFMVPVAGAGAVAVIVMAWFEGWWARRQARTVDTGTA